MFFFSGNTCPQALQICCDTYQTTDLKHACIWSGKKIRLEKQSFNAPFGYGKSFVWRAGNCHIIIWFPNFCSNLRLKVSIDYFGIPNVFCHSGVLDKSRGIKLHGCSLFKLFPAVDVHFTWFINFTVVWWKKELLFCNKDWKDTYSFEIPKKYEIYA